MSNKRLFDQHSKDLDESKKEYFPFLCELQLLIHISPFHLMGLLLFK